MSVPDFSIIVPTYDRGTALARCLSSLTALDYPGGRFEVIVVDDGGSLPLAPVTAQYEDRLAISVIRRENGGPAAARNTGARHAGGRYLAFTDDDCAPEQDWLTVLSEGLRHQSGCMVGGPVVNSLVENPYSAASQMIVDLVYRYYNPDGGPARFFASNNMALPAADFRILGGFDERFRTAEDRDLCDRWLGSGRHLVYEPQAVVRHAHRLDLHSFWRQHFGYGRGACRYYRAHSHRTRGKTTIEWRFYIELMRNFPRRVMQHKRGRVALLSLAVVWQAANLLGFVMDATAGNGVVQQARSKR